MILKKRKIKSGDLVVRFGDWRKGSPCVILDLPRWKRLGKPEIVTVEFTMKEEEKYVSPAQMDSAEGRAAYARYQAGISPLYEDKPLPEDIIRKVEAYDAARAKVKREGNTRAYYVLRAEEAEAEVERIRKYLELLGALIQQALDE